MAVRPAAAGLRGADPDRRVDRRLRADQDGAGRCRRSPHPARDAEGGRRADPRQAGPRQARCTCSTRVWLGRMVRGDLGISIVTNEPVAASLLNALGNTLMLAVPAAVLGFTLGTILGALAAFYHGTILDRVFSATAITGVSLPHYWVGIVLVAIFAVTLNALPAQGMGPGGIPAHLGAGEAPDPARVHAVAHPDGRGQPSGARQRPRDHRPGVRGGPARQGPARPARARARHEERRALRAWR